MLSTVAVSEIPKEKPMFELRVSTSPEWLEVVMADFDAFVVDHTLCERKASAMGMSLVAKYSDRSLLVMPLIEFAQEELEHFRIMYEVLAARGLRLNSDSKDEYVNGLRQLACKSGGDALLLDRLIIPGIVEARGCERLRMVTGAITEPKLKTLYEEITRAEARHHGLFFRLARHYFELDQIRERADYFFDEEAKLVESLPHRAAVH